MCPYPCYYVVETLQLKTHWVCNRVSPSPNGTDRYFNWRLYTTRNSICSGLKSTILNIMHLNWNHSLLSLINLIVGTDKLFDDCREYDVRHMLDDAVVKTCYNIIFILEVERLSGCERKTQKNEAHCKHSSRLSVGTILRYNAQESSSGIDNMTS